MKKVTAALGVSALVFTPAVAMAAPAPAGETCSDLGNLTILATTDNHGTALNYDYFTGEPFGALGEQNKARGLELLATAIGEVRDRDGAESVLLVDNGDANQGNPLETVYHSNREAGSVDPIAEVLNYLSYDAGVVGNHEFNYGLEDLAQYQDNLTMPLLGANVIDRATGEPHITPYTMVNKTVGGQEITIGVIGVVTPGVRIWDGPKVTNLEFQDQILAVQKYAPIVRAEGADVVVVLAHTGEDPANYTWNPADLQENALRSLAQNTEGVDVFIGGHSHVEDNFNTTFVNAAGENVLVSQPGYHGRFLAQVSVPLSLVDGAVEVVDTEGCAPVGSAIYASDYVGQEDPGVLEAIQSWHDRTLEWVATVVAQATEDMPASESAWEDTAILDFINLVQAETVEKALVGTEYENIPVLSQASPFSRTAIFNKGDVTIADMAALYVYDNTLFGSLLTGAQVKDYLEWSARYYIQQEEDAVITDWSTVTNAMYEGATRGVRDYAYDVLSGVNYHINISKPVGERIENLTYPDGTPVGDDDQFILAVNNYRQGGGSGYPHISSAPIVYDEQQAVRDLMISWAETNGIIDPNDFFVKNWTVSTSTVLSDEEPVVPADPAGWLFLTNSWSPIADLQFGYGTRTDVLLVGDWNGDGTDTLAVRRGNQYFIKNSLSAGPADQVVTFGKATDEVLVGDWNGDGTDTLAVRRGNQYFIKNTLADGRADQVVTYGKATDKVLVGDWDGDGIDTLAIRRGNEYFIKNTLGNGAADQVITYGKAADDVLVGDWNGDGTDTFAVRRDNLYFIKNTMTGGRAESVIPFGRGGDEAFVGDFDGDGADSLLLRR